MVFARIWLSQAEKMRQTVAKLFLLIGSLSSVFSIHAKDDLLIDTCYVYRGNNSLTIGEILQSSDYEMSTSGTPNLGLSSDFKYVKFKLPASNSDISFSIKNPSIDLLEVYSFRSGELKLEGTHGTSISNDRNGAMYSSFTFNHLKNENSWYLLKIKSGKQIVLPIQVSNPINIARSSNADDNLMFLYIGIILVLILYNLFLGISTGDINYLKYTLYILSIAITQIGLFGYGDRFIWGSNVWLTQNNVHLLGAISGITTILFARSFLRTKQYTPVIDKILLAYVGFDIVAIGLTLAGNYEMAYNLINFNAASSIILLIAGFQSMRKGNKSARFFLLAWTIFIFACTIFAMKDFGVLPYNFITSSSLPIGSALEGILLSFALADRINQLKLEKAKADADLIQTIQNQNELLESRVHDRTAELEDAKNELQSQYDHLRITQKQLVESEKLAGLGQMTAGIAHELNNPINFVQSNVGPLHRDIDEIMEVLIEFSQLPDHATPEQIAAVKAKCNSIGLDYLNHEINALLKGIAEGSRRTAEIVKGLRIFARTDSDTRLMANVNECIHSTLVVMKTMTKGQVKLQLDLNPNMPDIDCFPGKINQVVANLISNAVHATQQRFDQADQREIKVKSTFDDNQVLISVRDNGGGIEESKLSNIFVPFFTTKQVGQGTGLGLSIAKGIVEEHGGHIEVISRLHEGTEFIIHLPLNQKSNAKNAA